MVLVGGNVVSDKLPKKKKKREGRKGQEWIHAAAQSALKKIKGKKGVQFAALFIHEREGEKREGKKINR